MVLATWDCYRNKSTKWDSIIFQYANTIRRIQRQNWLLHNLSHFLFKHICFNTMRQKNRITKCRWKLLLYIFYLFTYSIPDMFYDISYFSFHHFITLIIFIQSDSWWTRSKGNNNDTTLSLLWADLGVNYFLFMFPITQDCYFIFISHIPC